MPVKKLKNLRGYGNYYLLTFNEDWADEHNVPALACMDEQEYKRWRETDVNDEEEGCRIYANLGNGGDDFGETFEHFDKMKDLVKDGYVSVTKVEHAFYAVFHKAHLASLSLSNVFTPDEDY